MSLTRTAVAHKPVTIVAALLAVVVGATTFLSMSRRENPRITIRSCLIETRWDGASAVKVEELVTELLEDVVYQIEEVEEIESTSRTGYSRIDVDLLDSVGPGEIDQVWDKVRNKVDLVRGSLPDGCGPPVVNSDFGDVSSICLALHPVGDGRVEDYTYRELEQLASDLEDHLKAIPEVASVTTFGVPEEVITLGVEAGEWARLGLSLDDLAAALDARNIANAGAVLTTDGRRLPLRPTGELGGLDDLADVVVTNADGDRPVTVRDLPFTIERTHRQPRTAAVRYLDPATRAPRAVLLGVAMKEGSNVVQLGEDVERAVERFETTRLPDDVAVTRINDLPRQVDVLVADFMESLWQAIVIVLGVAWLMMGWRPALVMATAIPLSMVTTLAIVPRFGVELEQFAIASLIIVLGMVVDNAIVVTDNVQRLINEGSERDAAAIDGADGLARSILSSTLTTVGAFLPMLTIPGESGEYMRSLPIVVSATLLTSYVVAMTVSPIMAAWLLRPAAGGGGSTSRLGALYTRFVRGAIARRALTIGLAGAAVLGAMGLTPLIGSQFFPGGVRDQLFIDVALPNGSSLDATERVVERIEEALLRTSRTEIEGETVERLVSATAFVGTGGPRLILSLDPGDGVPHEALLVVNTHSPAVSRPWVAELQRELADVAGARIDVRAYDLGPPLDSPVEFRLSGDDLGVLRASADRMLEVLEDLPGTTGVNSNWGELSYGLEVQLDADRTSLAGLSSGAVAATLSDLYMGGSLTTLREGDHLVPIELRLDRAQRTDPTSLEAVAIKRGPDAVPLTAIADTRSEWEDAAVARRNRVRTVTIGARVEDGFLANAVTVQAEPALRAVVDELPPGYTLEVGGESEQTLESQGSIGAALQVSIVLIFLVLLVQYNSLAKPFVVLTAFPLSLIGAMLGLFATGWPLGFMPMLGIVALAGTVINNAIVLIEFIETEAATGTPLVDAVASAGLARMRPILLTTLTTIGGLLPLALFGGPMWAGMSWAMIFGLALSTVLTLVVIPTVYVLFADRFRMEVTS